MITKKSLKYKTLLNFTIKVLVIQYLLMIFVTNITTETNAWYTSEEESTFFFSAIDEFQTPWDGSDLAFITQSGTCNEITATLKNNGQDMQGIVEYVIYYHEGVGGGTSPRDGDSPSNGAAVVASGTIHPLAAGETIVLSHTPTEKGKYVFQTTQRPGHQSNNLVWSQDITLRPSCFN